MERIFYRFEYWECFRYGLYDNSVLNKDELKTKVVELFSSPQKTEFYMSLVIKKWRYSCEHNLTNSNLNRVAWLGQAACCLYAKVPYRITMEAWHEVPEKFRNKADEIAKNIIDLYVQKLKNRQLCLKFI